MTTVIVVRATLREHEEKGKRLETLRAHLTQGIEQADRGEFVDDFNIEKVISDADRHASDRT